MKIINTKRVRLKHETLDRLLHHYSYTQSGRENDTKAYLCYVAPLDFLNAVCNETVFNKIASETGKLNVEALSKAELPYLNISKSSETIYNIVGHEGRHRMIALMRENFAKFLYYCLQVRQ